MGRLPSTIRGAPFLVDCASALAKASWTILALYEIRDSHELSSADMALERAINAAIRAARARREAETIASDDVGEGPDAGPSSEHGHDSGGPSPPAMDGLVGSGNAGSMR